MINRNNIRAFGDNAVFVGILLLAGSMALSKIGMSLGQFIIAGGWLLGGDVKDKFKRVFNNPVVWILWGVYFMHLIGLWQCHDWKLAGDDLRIKAPLFLMPLFFAGMKPLTDTQYRKLMGVVISGVVISTLISFAIYLGFTKYKVNDIRDICIFISHIRLSLLCCVSIVLLCRFIFLAKNIFIKSLYALVIGWLIYFMLLLQSLTGIGILLFVLFIYLFITLFQKHTRWSSKLSGLIVLFGLIYGFQLYNFIFVDSTKIITVNNASLPKLTHRGHRYTYFSDRQDAENGNLVWINICDQELDSAWSTKSVFKLYEENKNPTIHYFTLIRFLTSKGLTKDADGIAALSRDEIHAIEIGDANVKELTENKFKNRVRDLAWEYRQYYFTGDASGHSMTQRIEFRKNAIHIIKQHIYTGVGTGNAKAAITKSYIETKSKLEVERRLGPHNEYLLMGVLFGIGGIIYFVFSLIAPWFIMNKKYDFIYTAFLIIAICSMFTEDTIETQAGVTFYAFLNAVFLFSGNNEKRAESSSDSVAS